MKILTPIRNGIKSEPCTLRRTMIFDNGQISTTNINLSRSDYEARRDPLRRSRKDSLGWRPPTQNYSVIIFRRKPLSDTVRFVGRRDFGQTYDVLFEGDPGSNNIYSQVNYGRYFNSALGLLNPNVNARFRAETEALVKLADMKSNLGELLAEGKKSATMIAKSASLLLNLYLKARKGDWGGALREIINLKRTPEYSRYLNTISKYPVLVKELQALRPDKRFVFKSPSRDVAGRWLELQYGWMPLVGDIHGTYDHFKATLAEPKALLLSVVREVAHHLKEEDLCVRTALPYDIRDSNYAYATGRDSYRVKLYFTIDSSFVRCFEQIGLVNPFQVGWALVPFSFMVDWILPVESFLLATTAPVGLTFKSGTLTHRLACRVNEVFRPQRPAGSMYVQGGFERLVDVVAVNREIYPTWPAIRPYYKNPFSTQHAVNSLAIFRTLLKR